MSIKYKLLPVIVLGVVILAAILYAISFQAQQTALETQAAGEIQSSKQTFYNLVQNDIKMLQATITDFMTNQEYKDVYLTQDREKLYQYGQDLFAKHKELGITHFYFHRPTGTVFVRLHNHDKFDDKVTRVTYAASKSSKSWGSGIELGKTAFALRVVHPYYNGNELIGYIELGEEIDHFIEIMKNQTSHEYAIVVEKKYINPRKWASVRRVKGLRDNYDDLDGYVVIDTTMQDTGLFQKFGFTGQNLNRVTDDGALFGFFPVNDKSYASGGFSLYNAAGTKVGAVVTIQDITAFEQAHSEANTNMAIITIIGVLIISGIMVLVIVIVVIKPLTKVVDATTRIAGGDFTVELDVKSKDEIGQLAKLITQFRNMMANTASRLKKESAKKKGA